MRLEVGKREECLHNIYRSDYTYNNWFFFFFFFTVLHRFKVIFILVFCLNIYIYVYIITFWVIRCVRTTPSACCIYVCIQSPVCLFLQNSARRRKIQLRLRVQNWNVLRVHLNALPFAKCNIHIRVYAYNVVRNVIQWKYRCRICIAQQQTHSFV